MRAEAGEQHGEAEGFDEIVIGAGVEADDDIDLAAACGEDDEQDFRVVAADGAGQIDTIEVGKAEVQQNDSGLSFRATWMSAAPPVRHQVGRVAVAFETEMEMVPNGGVVFDNQHRRQRDAGPSGSCGRAYVCARC